MNIMEKEIAKSLLKIEAVGFDLKNLVTFKSGIKSPVYVDNRKLPFFPNEWNVVLNGFKEIIEKNKIDFDIIAGVEAGGIPHSAALGFLLNKPSIFIRKKAKEHGTKSMIEGGKVIGKKVLLIEDLVSTGGSSLAGIESIRNEGGIVNDCLAIVSYGFKEADESFKKANINLYSSTSFSVILNEAVSLGKISDVESLKIKEWFDDPHNWADKYNFK
jgi:orotate phosphoribosyltransferase